MILILIAVVAIIIYIAVKNYNCDDNVRRRQVKKNFEEYKDRESKAYNKYIKTPELSKCVEVVFNYYTNKMKTEFVGSEIKEISETIGITRNKIVTGKYVKWDDTDWEPYTVIYDFVENGFSVEFTQLFIKALGVKLQEKFDQANVKVKVKDYSKYAATIMLVRENPNYVEPKKVKTL